MTNLDNAARLAVAEEMARRAGALALDYFNARDRLTIESKRHLTDLVSEADREVETMIRSALVRAFPDDAQLGEEHGLTPGKTGITWVIDPIDGTAPFLAGLPGWCVSIGACDASGPLIGVIEVPVLGEHFAAMRGKPARLNGGVIRVSDRALNEGLLGVGANDRVPATRVGEMLVALSDSGSSWVRYGSGALMLACVAAGRLVGYAEPRMNAWDCMAGLSLIEAAGGHYMPFPLGDDMVLPAPVLGANTKAYAELVSLCRFDDNAFWESA